VRQNQTIESPLNPDGSMRGVPSIQERIGLLERTEAKLTMNWRIRSRASAEMT